MKISLILLFLLLVGCDHRPALTDDQIMEVMKTCKALDMRTIVDFNDDHQVASAGCHGTHR